MNLSLGHVALVMLVALLAYWIWRGMGLRDRALILVRQHCNKADVQLLDESVVLSKLRLGRNAAGQINLVRHYAFEFTVTGERRYPGHIELHGQRLMHVELAPHPFPGSINPDQPLL